MQLRVDHTEVTAPATVSHLGSAVDSMALAVSLRDLVRVRATAGATRVAVVGEDDGYSDLIVQALHCGLDHVGAPQVGADLWCRNEIPRGRGLGARTASILIGLTAARGLVGEPGVLDPATIVRLAVGLGADPLRGAAVLRGGAVLRAGDYTIGLTPPESITPVAFVPEYSVGRAEGTTHGTRDRAVSLQDATHNVAASSLLGMIMAGAQISSEQADFEALLFAATGDELHQEQQESFVPASLALLRWLRGKRVPALLSGQGPTVVSLAEVAEEIAQSAGRSGWQVMELEVAAGGVQIVGGPLEGPLVM